ncbi:MAG: DUF2156 domain-containing protein [Parachlamydia sp.]|nr:DUF2156 domain-containing protein [Parachlamydia sp.]
MKKLNKEKLSLHHQPLLTPRLKALNLQISDYSFANLYLFRDIHQYEVVFNNTIYIQGLTRDGVPFIMPTEVPTQLTLLREIVPPEFILYPIPSDWLGIFKSEKSATNTSDSDYLYANHKFAFYPGRKLSKKRNLVKQLLNQHTVQARPLLTLEEGLQILDKWRRDQESGEEGDYEACKEALEKRDQLGLDVQVVEVDGLASGFTIGESLNDDCYAIHFSKADKHIKGLYQYLYQSCAQTGAKSHSWINLEQDLGSPSLHLTKHSYQPNTMVEKHRIFIT